MKNSEILQKAIEKVGIEVIFPSSEIEKWKVIAPIGSDCYLSAFVWTRDNGMYDTDHTYEVKLFWQQIIFSHDFAKAFFPKGRSLLTRTDYTEEELEKADNNWYKHYLIEMVIEDDPIKYLEKFLEANRA